MFEINFDQSGIGSDQVGELFLGNDSSRLRPQLFKPLVSPNDEIEEMKLARKSSPMWLKH